MRYITSSDMGNIKIFNDDLSCFFANGFGDAENKVDIYTKDLITAKKHDTLSKERQEAEFLGHFTVKTKAYLSYYDCSDDIAHTFTKGRYFVFLLKPCHFHIEKVDEDTHA